MLRNKEELLWSGRMPVLFPDISDKMNRGSWGTWMSGDISSMYFTLNSTTATERKADPVTLNIQHTAGCIRPFCTSCSSRWDYQCEISSQRAAMILNYALRYYEQKDRT